MIEISIYSRDDSYIGFRSKGHADFDENGYDIVCAAVSILTQTLYFHLVDNLGIDDIDDSQESGYLEIILKNKYDEILVQDAFNFMIKGLELLEHEYSDYIKLKREVV